VFDIPFKWLPEDEFHHALVLFDIEPRVFDRASRFTLKSSKISDLEDILESTSPDVVTLCGDREYTMTGKFCRSSSVMVKKIGGMSNLIFFCHQSQIANICRRPSLEKGVPVFERLVLKYTYRLIRSSSTMKVGQIV
jgi:hypothetical protein